MLKHRFRHSLVASLVALALLVQGTWVLAGTTGGLSGTVTQTDTGAPIAGAKVTVTSPSQTATTTTDSGGHFTFVSLAPDTYTLSVEKSGFEPAALSGVAVLADQHPAVALSTRPTLQTIGRVTARSAAALVKPGTTADVYSVSAAQQTAVQGLGGGGSINQAYSAIASVPGVFVPQGQNGIYQSVYVRGGNYTELGYEFDGVPIQRAFDQYPSTFISSLGQQELQVYTGAAPADAQSTGLAGFINQVIKTGTYPGFANLELSLGSPTFYHKAMLEVGGATTNRNFSYYVAVAGYNQQFRFGSQWNGSQYDSTYGTPYNLIAANCGTRHAAAGCGFFAGGGYNNGAGIFGTPLAPNGYALGPFVYDFNGENDDREAVINLHFGIPHKNGTKDDIQLLYDNSYIYSPFQTSFYDWGPNGGNVLNGTAQYSNAISPNAGPNVPSCAASVFPCATLGGINQAPGSFGPFAYFDTTNYNGPMGIKLSQNNLTQVNNYYFPNSSQARAPFARSIPQNAARHERQPLVDREAPVPEELWFERLRPYLWLHALFRLASERAGLAGTELHRRRVAQLSIDHAHPRRRGLVRRSVELPEPAQLQRRLHLREHGSLEQPVVLRAVLRRAVGGRARQCEQPAQRPVLRTVIVEADGRQARRGAMTPDRAVWQLGRRAGGCLVTCSSGPALAPNYGATPSSSSTPAFPGVSLNTLSQFSCGGGPCEFYTAENGQRGAYNTVAPAFSNFELSDNWKPSEKWNVYGGIRWDDYIYHLTDTTVPAGPEPQAVSAAPRVLWQNSYNLFHCVQHGSVISVSTPTTTPGACPSGFTPANVSVSSPGSQSYNVWQPRLGLTYTFDPLDVVRGSWGEYAQPSSSAFQQYNNTEYNLPASATNEAFYPLGFFDPAHQVYPETSYNLDLSWEHQQKNTDISWKLTPFLRKTRNELYTVLLDPKTAFVSAGEHRLADRGRHRVPAAQRRLRPQRVCGAARLHVHLRDGEVRNVTLRRYGARRREPVDRSVQRLHGLLQQGRPPHSGCTRNGQTTFCRLGRQRRLRATAARNGVLHAGGRSRSIVRARRHREPVLERTAAAAVRHERELRRL